MKQPWKGIVIVVASALIGVCIVGLMFVVGVGLLFRVATKPPPQPKLGYTGDWRRLDTFGFEERALPPAKDVWKDYNVWKLSSTNELISRRYFAKLGGAERQSGFWTSISKGDTPMGAQRYTNVEFLYNDPTNGVYHLTWMLRGEHKVDFLRFNTNYRLYQLQPYGDPDDVPPKLHIISIERVKPDGP